MKLSVYDRLFLSNIIPQEGGSIRESIKINELRKKLRLSDNEIEQYGITTDDAGNIKWNPEKTKDKDYEFDTAMMDIIGLSFVKLEQSGKVSASDDAIKLYQKFESAIESARDSLTDSDEQG